MLMRRTSIRGHRSISLPVRKVIAAGGIRQYERIHLDVLTATFAPHFTHLPPEMVRRVVEYAFHVGDY